MADKWEMATFDPFLSQFAHFSGHFSPIFGHLFPVFPVGAKAMFSHFGPGSFEKGLADRGGWPEID